MSTPSADFSADILTAFLKAERPFFFARVGDGAIELLSGRDGHTCDDERYTGALAVEVGAAIGSLKRAGDRVIWGDWLTAVDGSQPKYTSDWAALVDARNRRLLNYEALLLMRRTEALLRFYSAARADGRFKMYVGPDAGAAQLLGCGKKLITRRGGQVGLLAEQILAAFRWHAPEVVYFAAGMAGLAAVVRYWDERPAATCVHLGSALDNVFHGRTRSNQLSTADARNFLRELL